MGQTGEHLQASPDDEATIFRATASAGWSPLQNRISESSSPRARHWKMTKRGQFARLCDAVRPRWPSPNEPNFGLSRRTHFRPQLHAITPLPSIKTNPFSDFQV
jgi:hypothetical protein